MQHQGSCPAVCSSLTVTSLPFCPLSPLGMPNHHLDAACMNNNSYSLCDWGVADPWLWGPEVGNSWRTDNDIQPLWSDILRSIDNTAGLARFAGPGGWNDPDMLEVRLRVIHLLHMPS